MKSSKLIFVCLVVASAACGSNDAKAPPATNGSGGTAGQPDSGGGAGGANNAGGGSGGISGSGGGATDAGGGNGDASDAAAGLSDSGTDTTIVIDGGVNMIPAGYTGTPFVQNVIPGFLYAANYDNGGPGVAFCHPAAAKTPAACAMGVHLTDWCCSDMNAQGTGARCDDRNQMQGVCPVYRPDIDNAGLSHMNLGEVDTFATDGPTWVAGPNGPTLTGPMVTVGTPVPQHANMTTADDTYLSYTQTGEWQKYTVLVLSAGMYSIGALMGTPPGAKVTFDFGGGVTVGPVALPPSPVSAACKCAEAYHAWKNTANIATVMFPAAGTYLLTLTLSAGQYNPLYFTFTKM